MSLEIRKLKLSGSTINLHFRWLGGSAMKASLTRPLFVAIEDAFCARTQTAELDEAECGASDN